MGGGGAEAPLPLPLHGPFQDLTTQRLGRVSSFGLTNNSVGTLAHDLFLSNSSRINLFPQYPIERLVLNFFLSLNVFESGLPTMTVCETWHHFFWWRCNVRLIDNSFPELLQFFQVLGYLIYVSFTLVRLQISEVYHGYLPCLAFINCVSHSRFFHISRQGEPAAPRQSPIKQTRHTEFTLLTGTIFNWCLEKFTGEPTKQTQHTEFTSLRGTIFNRCLEKCTGEP